MSTHRFAGMASVVISMLVGCSGGGGPTTTPTPTPVLTSIAISGGTTVSVGATLSLVASPKDQNGNAIAAAVSWSSGSIDIATVNGNGVVTGVAPGAAVITASSGNISATTTITVPAVPVLTSITMAGGTTVAAGQVLQLTASPKDQVGNPIAATLTWSSNATGVATVSTTGQVTGVTVGTAIITVTSGGVTATATITVTPAPPVLAAIVISGGTTVVANSALQLTGSPKDQYGNPFTASITWSSNATGVATVSSTGLVTGVSAGTAVITATSGSVNATQSITVASQVLTSITISGGSAVQVGRQLELASTARDQNGVAMIAVVTWASDATAVATVSSSGVVTGVAAGTAHITASAGAISSPPATVTVTPAPVFPETANVDATPGAVFSPATVDIALNGSVNWIFASLGHTVVFDTPTIGTPADISTTTSNATVSRTFGTAGTYNYHCTIHGGMTGTVIVH